MPNAEKVAKVEGLTERIRSAEALLLAEYRGLSVHDATELRRALAGHARFAIVKNTLMRRAADGAGAGDLQALLEGPTAVAFVREDAVAAAKTIVDAAKRFPALVLKGGYMDGKVLSAAEAQALATLESREVILSKLAGMMKAEMSRAASMFQSLQGRFLGLLDAYRDKLQAAAEPAAEEAPAAEPEAPDGEPEAAGPAAAHTDPEPEAASEPEPEPEAAKSADAGDAHEGTDATQSEEE